MSAQYEVISDRHSGHGLPIGAHVTPCDPPAWARPGEVDWYTQGADDDETAIDPRDLRPVQP